VLWIDAEVDSLRVDGHKISFRLSLWPTYCFQYKNEATLAAFFITTKVRLVGGNVPSTYVYVRLRSVKPGGE